MKDYYENHTVRNYTYLFNFEEEFQHLDSRVWMINHWTYGFLYCVIYMTVIFMGQFYMQGRPRFKLRGLLSAWNTSLAIFSIIGASRTAPELFHALRNHGLKYSVCVPRYVQALF